MKSRQCFAKKLGGDIDSGQGQPLLIGKVKSETGDRSGESKVMGPLQ